MISVGLKVDAENNKLADDALLEWRRQISGLEAANKSYAKGIITERAILNLKSEALEFSNTFVRNSNFHTTGSLFGGGAWDPTSGLFFWGVDNDTLEDLKNAYFELDKLIDEFGIYSE